MDVNALEPWLIESGRIPVIGIPPFIAPDHVHYQTREARTLQMEKEVFAKLEAFKAPRGKAVSLSQKSSTSSTTH